MTENPFEIPQSMRDLTEQNMEHAHAAYDQLIVFANNTMSSWIGATPASPMATDFKYVRERAMDFAKENTESALTFAGKVCNAKTPQEILTLQAQSAQDRMLTFVMQTQELYNLIGETLQKLQRGALGTEVKRDAL
jgi:hypothetical protein